MKEKTSKPREYRCEIRFDGTLCNLHPAHNLITGEIAEGETEETIDKLLPVKKGDVIVIAARQQEPDDLVNFHKCVWKELRNGVEFCHYHDHAVPSLWEHDAAIAQAAREETGCPYWNPDVNIYPDEPENHCTCQFSKIREDERKRLLKDIDIKIAIFKEHERNHIVRDQQWTCNKIRNIIKSLRTITPAPGNRTEPEKKDGDYQCGDNCHGECSGEYDGKIHCPESEPEKKDGE